MNEQDTERIATARLALEVLRDIWESPKFKDAPGAHVSVCGLGALFDEACKSSRLASLAPAAEAEACDANGNPRIYPCALCPTMRSAPEGGTTFTVCDVCWEREYRKRQPAAPALPVPGRDGCPEWARWVAWDAIGDVRAYDDAPGCNQAGAPADRVFWNRSDLRDAILLPAFHDPTRAGTSARLVAAEQSPVPAAEPEAVPPMPETVAVVGNQPGEDAVEQPEVSYCARLIYPPDTDLVARAACERIHAFATAQHSQLVEARAEVDALKAENARLEERHTVTIARLTTAGAEGIEAVTQASLAAQDELIERLDGAEAKLATMEASTAAVRDAALREAEAVCRKYQRENPECPETADYCADEIAALRSAPAAAPGPVATWHVHRSDGCDPPRVMLYGNGFVLVSDHDSEHGVAILALLNGADRCTLELIRVEGK